MYRIAGSISFYIIEQRNLKTSPALCVIQRLKKRLMIH